MNTRIASNIFLGTCSGVIIFVIREELVVGEISVTTVGGVYSVVSALF